jgi:hypothetical protein
LTGNSNRSTVILSDNGENGNQVDTYIDTVIKSYETDLESSTSSTESGAEASVTPNTTNRQIQATGCLVNVKATNVTVIASLFVICELSLFPILTMFSPLPPLGSDVFPKR